MKGGANRAVILASAAAALASVGNFAGIRSPATAMVPIVPSADRPAPAGNQSQLSAGAMAAIRSAWGGGGTYRLRGAAFNPTRGWTVAHSRRMARKRRNVLRARGQHRKAVR